MPLPEWVSAGDARVDEGAIVGYAWTDPPPKTTLGNGCVIRAGAIVYAGAELGDRVHVAHGALVRQFTRIGDDASIGSRTIVEHDVQIGNRVRIHSGAFIPELTVVEDDAWIGPMVCVTNARYPMMGPKKTRITPVRIMRFAKIGAAAVLLPGIVVGERALIGAGSVVTTDVPAGVVMVGNPARVAGDLEEIERKVGAT